MTFDAVRVSIEPGTSMPVVLSESTAMIGMIERAARDPAVDVDKFERLMVLKERLDKQEAERAFNAAVAAAKAEIPTIVKNRSVDFTSAKGRTNYRHEDFAEITDKVDPVLGRHGLSYRFRSAQAGQKLTVTCIVSHARGHSEETTLESSEDHSGNKNTIQAIGSAATYLQRYTLKLALGLAASADDDAKKAAQSARVSDEQAGTLREMIESVDGNLGQFLGYFRIERLADLPADQYDRALAAIRKRAGQ